MDGSLFCLASSITDNPPGGFDFVSMGTLLSNMTFEVLRLFNSTARYRIVFPLLSGIFKSKRELEARRTNIFVCSHKVAKCKHVFPSLSCIFASSLESDNNILIDFVFKKKEQM